MITTSTRVEAADIAGLLERVEKATGRDRELDLALAQALVPDVIVLRRNADDTANEPYTYWEYTSSIDAALALVERMLPGWGWQMTMPAKGGTQHPRFGFYLWPPGGNALHGYSETISIAILAALLKALRSLSQGAGHEQ